MEFTQEELIAALAQQFAVALTLEVGEENMKIIRKRNLTRDKGVCHSHDFCDANVVMDDAFQRVMERPSTDDDTAMWSYAWSKAIEDEFAV